ncbi:MAG: cell division protein SepF [Candidatus Eremiobacteraeota bacterium]|nr:cell division protein SepF [Candidatus Eremiobacteraeota bacterium]MBV8281839.1 cell division protein SepF [Candidatus Eremiobacteraeota bacterium]
MGLWSSIVSSMGFRDSDDFDEDLFDEAGKPKVVPINDARGARKIGVSVFHPRQYDEVTEIADNLRARLLVVVNLVGADRALSQRVIDFLSGVVYTLDGKMQRLSEGIFLFVPSNVQVSAKEPELAAAGSYEAW